MQTDVTSAEYIRNGQARNCSKQLIGKKFEIARKYIEDGKMRVYEIADSIGWEDTAYFSRVFKKYTGYSPKEYEKLYRR